LSDTAYLLHKTSRLLWRLGRIALPKRWHLPLRYALDLRGACEPELRYLSALGPNEGTAVDIGANAGIYSYALARLYDTVYAFEPNPYLLDMLRAYASDDIHVSACGLSDTSGKAVLHIPQVRGQDLTGWATLDPAVYPTVDHFRTLPVTVKTLDSQGLQNVCFIKMDVEGHELQVLEGARETIGRCRPHVLVEIKPQHLVRAHAFFDTFGYDITRLDQINGRNPSGNNFIFVPH
jgi:FkbM family methyltransferase